MGAGSRFSPLTGVAAVLAAGGLFVPACSSDEADAVRRGKLAEGCLINSDCEDPLVCAFRRCHRQCNSSKDCEPGQRCVISDRPAYVCQLDDEKECLYHSQCPSPQFCAIDGECRNQCLDERDCIPGQLCVSSACADPEELDKEGRLPRKLGDAAVGGQPCSYTSECVVLDPAFVCHLGYCRYECLGTPDCPAGATCVEHECKGGTSGGDAGTDASAEASLPCKYNSDCSSLGPGWVCLANACIPQCKGDVDCVPGQKCQSNQCVWVVPDGAPDGYFQQCNLSSDCQAPLICGASGQCVYQCVVASDCVQPGACCVAHQCATGQLCKTFDAGTGDGGSADGGSGDACPTKGCLDNKTCDDGKYCNGLETCKAGCCGPALDTPCNSHSSCIEDYCDEATQACSHKILAAKDVDGDGHDSYGCSSGDDCDDLDPTAYPGAAELCDGKDNDCNTLVDDRSRRPFGPLVSMNATPANGNSWTVGSGAPLGADWVLFWGDWTTLAYEQGDVFAQKLDAAGASLGAPVKVRSVGTSTVNVLDAAGGATSAAVVYDRIIGSTKTRFLTVVGPTLSALAHFTLCPSGYVQAGDADLAWTGAQFVVGYSSLASGTVYGNLMGIKPDGTTAFGGQPLPTTAGSGALAVSVSARIRVAWSGATLAAAYHDGGDTRLKLSIFSSTGSLLTGPVSVTPAAPGPKLLGVGGSTNGYVVVWSDTAVHATFIAADGTVGATKQVPYSAVPTNGFGDTDGAGATFALQYVDGLRFGYARGTLTDPFEITVGIEPGTVDSGDYGTIAGNALGGSSQRTGLFFWGGAANRQYAKAVGCGP